jgi:hypothetical protein
MFTKLFNAASLATYFAVDTVLAPLDTVMGLKDAAMQGVFAEEKMPAIGKGLSYWFGCTASTALNATTTGLSLLGLTALGVSSAPILVGASCGLGFATAGFAAKKFITALNLEYSQQDINPVYADTVEAYNIIKN